MKETNLFNGEGNMFIYANTNLAKLNWILEKSLTKTMLCVSTQYPDRKGNPKMNYILLIKFEI